MIKVADIAYVRLRAPDLDLMEKFLVDFGLVRSARTENALYMRGTDPAHYIHVTERGEPGLASVAFLARSEDDLRAIAGRDGGSAIEPIDEPGGGRRVRFTDPNGFQVDVVHGIENLPAIPVRAPFEFNDATHRRRLGALRRVEKGPSHVKRLGHAVVNVRDFGESESWYKARFGLLSSDELRIGDAPIASFLRCDRGDECVDHHTFLTVGIGQPGFDHAAFEVIDLDDVMVGHDHLKAAGYQHSRGIGRHILGSQIFDYWNDPWGQTVEHWTDGDRLNASVETQIHGPDAAFGSQWGAPSLPGAPR